MTHSKDPRLHLVPRLRMCGTIPSLPHTISLCGVYLSTGYISMASLMHTRLLEVEFWKV